jgi:hypothetical protein
MHLFTSNQSPHVLHQNSLVKGNINRISNKDKVHTKLRSISYEFSFPDLKPSAVNIERILKLKSFSDVQPCSLVSSFQLVLEPNGCFTGGRIIQPKSVTMT